MSKKSMAPGLFGDSCPRCRIEDSKTYKMVVMHTTGMHDYSAPKGHNGDVGSSVEWCPQCGTVRQCVNYGSEKSVRLLLTGNGEGW